MDATEQLIKPYFILYSINLCTITSVDRIFLRSVFPMFKYLQFGKSAEKQKRIMRETEFKEVLKLLENYNC